MRHGPIAVLLGALLGCQATHNRPPGVVSPAAPPRAPAATTRPDTPRRAGTTATTASCASATPSRPTASAPAEIRYDLDESKSGVDLPAGRWVVRVSTPAKSFVTIGVSGPPDALTLFEVLSRKLPRLHSGTREADGRLPAFVSFASDRDRDILVIVDATQPVRVLRAHTSIYEPPKRAAGTPLPPSVALPLVGLPFPIERSAGYFLQAPHRYQFARADVATALRVALKQTRRRFKRNAIGIGDISQWNGVRPATDQGKARHISHQGGRDVDIGLPALKGSSALMRRCDGVLVDDDVLKCGPGTVEHVDGMRLAYLLGLLIDGPTPGGRYIKDADRRPGPIAMVETIFTDQAYIDEIRKALPELKKKRWIHDEAYSVLAEEGVLRPSPWHVDHVHIRFSGSPATTPAPLDFGK